MASPGAIDERPPLAALRPGVLSRLALRPPLAWTSTRRRRRLLFLALAAPGFIAVFTTTLHRNLFIAAAGMAMFAAAVFFRRQTEAILDQAAHRPSDTPNPQGARP